MNQLKLQTAPTAPIVPMAPSCNLQQSLSQSGAAHSFVGHRTEPLVARNDHCGLPLDVAGAVCREIHHQTLNGPDFVFISATSSWEFT